MAKVMTVEEALGLMRAKTNAKGEPVTNRFNKKNLNTLMVAMANDIDFTTDVAKKVGDKAEVEKVLVTKGFRKWIKNLVEKAGVDPAESERVMTPDFIIDNMEGVYDFFESAIYTYMEAGNRFDFHSREDFQGGLYVKNVKEGKKTYEARNPKDGSYLGTFETSTKAHKVLAAKSSCPTYLSSKRQVK